MHSKKHFLPCISLILVRCFMLEKQVYISFSARKIKFICICLAIINSCDKQSKALKRSDRGPTRVQQSELPLSRAFFILQSLPLRKTCPYLDLFWSAFPQITSRSISLYSVQMLEDAEQNNSKYGHFSCSVRTINVVHWNFLIIHIGQWSMQENCYLLAE